MKIFNEFRCIASDDALSAFLKVYALVQDSRPTKPQTFGVYVGRVEGRAITVTHWWYDPSGPFQNEPDVHKAKLEVEGFDSLEVDYNG